MALVLKDRVKETSTTTGTGTFTLAGASTGYQSFSAIGNGNTTYYVITDPATGSWEVGLGTYTSSGTTLSRTTILSSSNAGSVVDFQAGTKEVFCAYPAEKAIYEEAGGETLIDGGPITVIGNGVTVVPALPAELGKFVGNDNLFAQIYCMNQNTGTSASADFVAYNDLTTDGYTHFTDIGINSSNYTSVDYPIFTPGSGYLFHDGDHLFIGTATSNKDVVIFTGGVDTPNEAMRILGTDQSVELVGDLTVGGTLDVTGAASFGSTVLLDADPTLALQAATKQYVDNAVSSGIHIHEQVYAETSASLSAVYTQGGTTDTVTTITGTDTITFATATPSVNDEVWFYTSAGNGLSINTPYFVQSITSPGVVKLSLTPGGAAITGLTNAAGLTYAVRLQSGVGAYLESSANATFSISGVTGLTTGQRILVYGQSTGYWNGVYTITSMGSGASKWKLTRATDQDHYDPSSTTGMGAGDYFFVTTASESYVLTTEGAFIIGYDTITYTLFSAATVYTGTSPIDVTGSVISLTTVPATLGGTGQTTVTPGDFLYGTMPNTWGKLAAGSQFQSIVMGAGLPYWGGVALDQAAAVSGTLPATYGGTGSSTYTLGDTLYSSAANTLSKLAGNTTTTTKYLKQTGTGAASAAPSWDTIAAADITSGTLAVARGGTNIGSYTTGDLLYASGTTTLATLADAATGNVLLSGGAGVAPSYGKVVFGTHTSGTVAVANGGTGLNSLTAGYIPYGNGTSAFASSSALTFNGSTLRINAADSPYITLVNGTTKGVRLGADATGGFVEGVDSTGSASYQPLFVGGLDLRFLISGAEKMRLDSSGNLGLGVTPSAWGANYRVMQLGASGSIFGRSTAYQTGIYDNIYAVGSTFTYNASTFATGYLQTSGQHQWFNAPSGTAGTTATFTQAMTLNASGNLGIGTSSPSGRLAVVTAGTAGATQLGIYNDTDAGGATLQYIGSTFATTTRRNALEFYMTGASSQQIFYTNATERMRLDSSGNLGLGVTPSAWGATTKAIQVGSFGAVYGSTTNYAGISSNRYNDGANKYIGTGLAALYEQGLGVHAWYVAPTGVAGGTITFTQAMTLNASGNLGIGTSSPTEKLDVSGNIAITGTGNLSLQRPLIPSARDQGTPQIAFKYYSTGTTYTTGAQISALTEAAWSSTSAPTNIVFSTVPSGSTTLVERLRIDSAGNLGLGVTPSAWGSNFRAIELNGGAFWSDNTSGGANVNLFKNTIAANGYTYTYESTGNALGYGQNSNGHFWVTAPSGTAGAAITFTQAMTLDASGNLGVGITSPTSPLAVTGPTSGNSSLASFGATSTYRAQFQYLASVTGYYGTGLILANDNGSNQGASRIASRYIGTGGPGLVFETSSTTQSYGADPGTLTYTERMRIDSSGNVGIGIAGGTYKLDVSGTVFLRGNTNIYSGTGGAVNSSTLTFGSAALTAAASVYGKTDTATAGNLVFATAQSGSGTMTERMRIDSSGKVGIGTTSPSSYYSNNLVVSAADQGGITIASTATTGENYLAFGDAASGDARYAGYIGYSHTANYIRFGTNSTERARIDTSGNLLVGTTTAVAKVTVAGDVSANFYLNSNTISANYTVPANYNAMTAGPITVATGVAVTVSTGANWVIV